jgi:arginyl-tRNA synthetase
MKDRDFSEKEKKKISEKLAIATLKYSILKVTSGKNISFDMEKDTNPQGDTATFLLYTYVRTESIFRTNDKDLEFIAFSERKNKIPEIEKMLYRFNEVVEKTMEDYSPHHLAKYLYDLAKKFNSLYETTNFSDKDNEDFNYNFALLRAFGKTMEKGLELLGIETVEKM